MLSFARTLGKHSWKEISSKLLFTEWKKLETLTKSWAFWLVFPQTVDSFLEIFVTELIKHKTRNGDVRKIFGILIKPDKKIFSEEELADLYKIASYKNLPDNKLAELIKKHVRKYGWIASRWWHKAELSEAEIMKRIDEAKRNAAKILKENDSRQKEDKKVFNRYVRDLKLNHNELRTIKLVKEIVYLRTYRTDIVHHSGYLLKTLFEATAKYFGISYDDLLNLQIQEILAGLKPDGNISIIRFEAKKRRDSNWVYRAINGKGEISYTKIENGSAVGKIKNIRGSTVYQGKVTGIVKIVRNKSDFSKINDGDILVTAMTSPDFVQVLRKVNGIVTDEGGITSHASIVAREMQKPCIIGTKIATKVLKDGDLVEVNANSGIVKIIKKASDR